MTPQVKTLLNHLQTNGSISQAEASTVYRMRALPRRISDLKEHFKANLPNHSIRREIKKDTTGQRYARYYLQVLKVGVKITITNANPAYGEYKNGDVMVVTQVSKDGSWVYAVPEGECLGNDSLVFLEEFEVVA
jgi:hypothetical protein